MEQLEQYYRDNFNTLCKSMANRAGGLYNAEDVIQEAFLRAMTYIDSFDAERSEMSTWFGKIAKRSLYDFKRQETLQGLVREEHGQVDLIQDFRELGVSTSLEIEKEIEGRRENHKEVLRLAYVKGYRPREIVEIVDETIHNIYKIIKEFKSDMEARYRGYPTAKATR